MLTLESVSRSFGAGEHRRCVLDRVSLSIPAATETAIIGRSGCGKSTLLNIISGIDRPDAGRVIFDGQDLNALREPQRTVFRRRKVGFVYQFFNLLPTLDVEENVRLVLALDGIAAAECRRRTRAILERVGLAERLHAPVDTLSGGEQQRVALARALVHRPALLLADEPTGNLDEVTAAQISPLLRELAREHGATVILATHDRQLAAGADRCLTLRAGELV
ncbi:MAG TPA: ABC transporter ATP-binding protein [Steroidobacteraceae bacterium]|nr:ABC transporter ATP-binding protein [Steroidobacteraceae bacterium]